MEKTVHPTSDKFIPFITPETRNFWEGTKLGELRIQKCDSCGHKYFPPRPFCPKCSSKDISVVLCSGEAKLYSYVISHLPAPGFEPPFSIAVVELLEGPRLMSNVIGCPQTPSSLILDMPLAVVYEKLSDEITLPLFKPTEKLV